MWMIDLSSLSHTHARTQRVYNLWIYLSLQQTKKKKERRKRKKKERKRKKGKKKERKKRLEGKVLTTCRRFILKWNIAGLDAGFRKVWFALDNSKQTHLKFLNFHQLVTPDENEIILAKRGVRATPLNTLWIRPCIALLRLKCAKATLLVRQIMGKIWGNLEIAYKVFSLLILVVQTLTLKNLCFRWAFWNTQDGV